MNLIRMKTIHTKSPICVFSFPRKLKMILCMLATGLWIVPASAQSYYPGGLGNSNLIVWVNAKKASSITQNGSNQVSQWADLSGNGYNFSQGTSANKPVYGATSGPNSRPALTFTSTSSQYLSTPTLPASISFTGGVSTFTVSSFNAPQTAQGWQRVFDFGSGQGSNNVMIGRYANTAGFYYEGWNGASGDETWTTTSPIVNGTNNVFEAVQQGGAVGNLTTVALYVAGTSQAATGQAGSSQTWVPTSVNRTSNYIGRSNWAADNYFAGTMSEILLYNSAFNTTQRVIMENYLSAEWGETVSVSKYTTPTATTYGTSLVGIGYTSALDNFPTNPAGSTDGLGFSSGTGATDFLHAAGYLMAAHNGQANTVITNATPLNITSASALTLWNRSWNVQKTGGNATGLITLNFNFSDYNGTAPVSTNTFALLYNATDGTFATGANQLVTTSSTSVVGNVVSFGVSAANLANGYYSILYSTSPIALPVILDEFTTTRQGGASLLEWSTSMETGSSHFEIERSTDGSGFTTIGTVAAKGAGTTTSYYSFTDSKPAAGLNYYRLKMVDQDGSEAYSAIRSVDFGTGAVVSLNIYPNPAANMLHIVISNTTGVASILVINMQGQVVRTVQTTAAAATDIPVNDLARGVYMVEVNTGAAKYTQAVLKN